MTTTSVKNAGSVMNLGVQMTNASAKSANGSFQTVLDSQTEGNRTAPKQEQTVQKADGKDNRTEDMAKPGEDLRAKDSSQKDISVESTKTAGGQDSSLTEEEMEEAMEVVMTAVTDLIQQIADVFGMSVESVQSLMSDLNLQPMDLLQPENLGNLLLMAGGAQDTTALLTNEQLYADYQMLMEQAGTMLRECSETLGMASEQLQQALAMPQDLDVQGREEPLIEIDGMDQETNDFSLQMQKPGTSPENVQDKADFQENGGGARQEAGNGTPEKAPEEGGGNLVLQTMKDDVFQPRVEDAQPMTGAGETDTQDIMRQIMDYMKIQVKSDVSSLEMQLHPENLGTLQIHVAAKGGVLTANFITQNEAVKAALESQMIQLKDSFEEQGVKVEAIEVTVQTHQFEQNLEQGRGRQDQGTPEGRRPRTRKINLGGLEESTLPEEMEEEDRITAEMMAANGTTVDFTA